VRVVDITKGILAPVDAHTENGDGVAITWHAEDSLCTSATKSEDAVG
jgi:hypothetical protein